MPFVSCTTPSYCAPGRGLAGARALGRSGGGHAPVPATPRDLDADKLEMISHSTDVADRVAVGVIWRGAGAGPEADLEMTVRLRGARRQGLRSWSSSGTTRRPLQPWGCASRQAAYDLTTWLALFRPDAEIDGSRARAPFNRVHRGRRELIGLRPTASSCWRGGRTRQLGGRRSRGASWHGRSVRPNTRPTRRRLGLLACAPEFSHDRRLHRFLMAYFSCHKRTSMEAICISCQAGGPQSRRAGFQTLQRGVRR